MTKMVKVMIRMIPALLMASIALTFGARGQQTKVVYEDRIETSYRMTLDFDDRGNAEAWGGVRFSGSDAATFSMRCSKESREFCLEIPGRFRFHLMCAGLTLGSVWRSGNWSYKVEQTDKMAQKYMITARNTTMLSVFVYEKDRGVIEITTLSLKPELGSFVRSTWDAVKDGIAPYNHICGVKD